MSVKIAANGNGGLHPTEALTEVGNDRKRIKPTVLNPSQEGESPLKTRRTFEENVPVQVKTGEDADREFYIRHIMTTKNIDRSAAAEEYDALS